MISSTTSSSQLTVTYKKFEAIIRQVALLCFGTSNSGLTTDLSTNHTSDLSFYLNSSQEFELKEEAALMDRNDKIRLLLYHMKEALK
jgi:hypothetical protein